MCSSISDIPVGVPISIKALCVRVEKILVIGDRDKDFNDLIPAPPVPTIFHLAPAEALFVEADFEATISHAANKLEIIELFTELGRQRIVLDFKRLTAIVLPALAPAIG
jgi:hypothetical protein